MRRIEAGARPPGNWFGDGPGGLVPAGVLRIVWSRSEKRSARRPVWTAAGARSPSRRLRFPVVGRRRIAGIRVAQARRGGGGGGGGDGGGQQRPELGCRAGGALDGQSTRYLPPAKWHDKAEGRVTCEGDLRPDTNNKPASYFRLGGKFVSVCSLV